LPGLAIIFLSCPSRRGRRIVVAVTPIESAVPPLHPWQQLGVTFYETEKRRCGPARRQRDPPPRRPEPPNCGEAWNCRHLTRNTYEDRRGAAEPHESTTTNTHTHTQRAKDADRLPGRPAQPSRDSACSAACRGRQGRYRVTCSLSLPSKYTVRFVCFTFSLHCFTLFILNCTLLDVLLNGVDSACLTYAHHKTFKCVGLDLTESVARVRGLGRGGSKGSLVEL
jgi:hypothetical protein